MTQENNIVQKIRKIGAPKTLCIVLIIMVAGLKLYPMGLPVPISSTTQSFYDFVEDFEGGQVVAVQCLINSMVYAEAKGGIKTIIEHLFSKDAKLVFFNVYLPESPPILNTILNTISDEIKGTYGEDYVVYGYISGEEASLTAIGNSFWDAFPADQYGTPNNNLPIMQDVHSSKDFSFIVSMGCWFPASEASVRQWVQTFNKPLIMLVDAAQYMALQPYYPDQIKGLISGVTGSAQYELLTNKPGISISFTDAISGMAIILIIAIAFGNIYDTIKKKEV